MNEKLNIAEPGGRNKPRRARAEKIDAQSSMKSIMSKIKQSSREESNDTLRSRVANTASQLKDWSNNWETSIDESFGDEDPNLTSKKQELSGAKEEKQPNIKSNFDKLADVIIGYEGFKAKAYDDYGQTSIGYGSKASNKNQTVTEEKAKQMLMKDIDSFYKGVLRAEKKYKYNFTENQRLALTMFAHNNGLGEGTEGKNIKGLKQLLDEGKRGVEEISDSIELYNKAGGKVLQGLVDRRAKEYEIFNYGFEGKKT